MTPELIGILAALGSAATWAVGAMLLKPFADRLPAAGMAFLKGVLGLIVLGAAILVKGAGDFSWQAGGLLFASGVLGIAIADSFFFKALKELSPYAIVQLMLLGQVATIGMALVFLDERLFWIEWLGVLCVIVGVWVVIAEPRAASSDPGAMRRGIAYGLVSVLSMAISATVAKGSLAEVDVLTATFLRIAGGVFSLMVFAPMLLKGWDTWLTPIFADRRVAVRFSAIATFVTFGGFFLSLVALKYTPLVIANTLLSTEPLFVLAIMFMLYREIPAARRVGGSLAGAVGIGLISSKGLFV